MTRLIRLLFGVAAYLLFFLTFLYFIAFVDDFPLVPLSVSSGPYAPAGVAVAIDVALIALFGVQHSVMARPRFKAAWTRVVPPAAERSVYVLLSSLALILLFIFWRPFGGTVWTVDGVAGGTLRVLGLIGWGVVLMSSFLISHFELFGLSQSWRGIAAHEGPPRLRTPFLYRWVRHPLYLGFVMALWLTDEMTASRLLLAAGLTLYVLIGIAHEERDLIGVFGDDYVRYRQRAGMLTPRVRGRAAMR